MLILETVLILIVLVAGFLIVSATMRTGISPSPSSAKVVKAMTEAVKGSGAGLIVDLGSGWGTLVCAFAREYPHRQVIGYELSPVPWLFSMARKYICGLHNLTLYRKDFLSSDLSNASVLTCYLFSGGMVLLKDKLESDKLTDILIVSSTFALPSSKPDRVIYIDDIYKTPVYIYRLRRSKHNTAEMK